MICQLCAVEAPTKYVEFYSNIGLLVLRFHNSIKGRLCKRCIHKTHWKHFATNFFLGWWGIISFFATIFFLANNTVRYLGALGLGPVPPGATAPQLTEDAARRIQPHTDDLVARVNANEDLNAICGDLATKARVTPGQVVLYLRALIEASKQRR